MKQELSNSILQAAIVGLTVKKTRLLTQAAIAGLTVKKPRLLTQITEIDQDIDKVRAMLPATEPTPRPPTVLKWDGKDWRNADSKSVDPAAKNLVKELGNVSTKISRRWNDAQKKRKAKQMKAYWRKRKAAAKRRKAK